MQSNRWQLLASLLIISTAQAEETTTGNLINDYGWSVDGGLLNHNNHHHTDYQGGSVTQTIDLSDYEGQISYDYSTQVYACGNRIGGDCNSGTLDTFTVTLTLDTGETWIDSFMVSNQWEDIDITYTPTSDAQYATLELFGQDNGYWAGWYGPVFYSGSFTVTFDPTLTQVIMPAANPELTTVLPSDPTNDPSMGTISPDLGTVEVPQVQVQTVEVAPTPVAAPQQQQAAPQQTAQAQPQQTQQQSSEQPKSESKSSGKVSVKTAAGVVSANIDVANASTQSVGDAFGDPSNPVAQAVMVAVMASNGVSLSEARLVQPKLQSPLKMRDRALQDIFWLDSLRSEARFQKHMVDKQWQK